MITIKIDKPRKLNSIGSMFVSFPYDERILNIVRSFNQRAWDKDRKIWELQIEDLGKFIEQLPDQEFDISGKYIELPTLEAKIPAGFEFKTTPFQHQIDGFMFGLSHDRWFLGDEQGLGKTKQVIDIAIAKKLQRNYKHCLIICGVNGLKWNWKNEIAIHSNESGWILGQRIAKNGKISIGSNQDKLADLQSLNEIKDYFIITNVESLREEAIAKQIQKLCANKTIGVVAIDEIHKCKNSSSQQGKGILKIQSECRIAMTGTPIMNNPLDLYVILKWLGYENHSFYQFKNHYCEMGGYGGYEIIGYKNLADLKAQTDVIMLRRLKENVLDLPDKLYIDEYIEMNSKQWKIYNEVTADIKNNIDKIKSSVNPLAELIRMRQATGFTGILSSTIQESAKLDRMEELVDEAVENGKKVVIFSNWTQMTLPIYNRLAVKYHGTYITGEVDSDQRQDHVKRFQEDDDCKFIVGTIGAMGTGLTLTAGTIEIFMDEPWTKAAKEQAEDRCHRVGTQENVTIYTLMCKNTIDEKIHELVIKKGEIADAMIDSNLDMNRSDILDFLLS